MKKIIIWIISIILIGTIIYLAISLYLSQEYRLWHIGYSKEDIVFLKEKLDKDELEKVTEYAYLENLKILLENPEYQKENLEAYLEKLANGEAIEKIYVDLDPLVISLRKEKYYIEYNLSRYLAYQEKCPDKELVEVVRNVNAKIDNDFYTNVVSTDTSKDLLMLVNKYHQLSPEYRANLVTLSSKYGGGSLEKRAAAAFVKMCDAAKTQGIKLRNVSGYRSYYTQRNLYNNYVNRDGISGADRYSARAGHSEHQTGLATDINTASSKAHFERTKEFAWLSRNAHLYGFILRYPEGKEYLTGYKYEPWHYRYVGVEAATYIHENNITYEEYYAYYVAK